MNNATPILMNQNAPCAPLFYLFSHNNKKPVEPTFVILAFPFGIDHAELDLDATKELHKSLGEWLAKI